MEAAYLEARGERYPWGGVDWDKLRECLSLAEGAVEVLVERYRFALQLQAEGKWGGCNTLAQLKARWADVLGAMQRRQPVTQEDEDEANIEAMMPDAAFRPGRGS